MDAYRYDPETKVYTGIMAADPDPFHEGEFILPGHSTFTAPPAEKAGFNRVWNGDLGKWEYVKPTFPQDFIDACAQFRQICHTIGEAIEDPDFKGGFDQMQEFASSPVYGTIEGLKLGLAWSAANQNCKYTGQRSGFGQPQWWYKCWQLQELDTIDI